MTSEAAKPGLEAEASELRPEAPDLRPVHVHIEPPRGWMSLDLRGLWAYRELLYFLAWRDVKVRYKQTVLGAAWTLGRPQTRWSTSPQARQR